jgi:uncharacterized protein (DUF342 family)
MAVSFSDDDLEARADFLPPMGKGEPITKEYINALLEKFNILHGVRWEDIEKAAMECNLNRKLVKDVVIARGDPPVDAVAEYFERNPHLGRPANTPEDTSQIDYRAYSPFTIVKQGQILALLHPQETGQDGKNIHGTILPHRIVKPEGVTGGENTRFDGKSIVAAINGQLVESKNILAVQDFLVIKGAVGYRTGNIIFPGDVVIEGPVSDGFKIYSGGSVTIKQTFDVTDVITKTDLSVAGGIIGRGRALVKVGGSLKTKFIENCRVACRKGITVDTEIINSSVFTMEHLDMGDKGLVLGSDIYAIHGIRVGGIGKKAGKASKIHCGIDFTIQQEKEKNNNQLRILAAKLGKLRELMAAPDSRGGVSPGKNPDGRSSAERHARLEELLHRLEEEQKKTTARISDLLGSINTDEDAEVQVSGEIVPGTLIEICQIALFVTEPLSKVRIHLDKASGKLISQGL